MIDTHAHLFVDDYIDDLQEVVARAKNIGVEKVLLPNIDAESIESLKNAVKMYPDFLLPMMGLHPTSVTNDWRDQLGKIEAELNRDCYIGVGEIGIDLYWDKSLLEAQQEVFEQQLEWSATKGLPVSIHSRNAIDEVIASIKRVGENKLFGVFHSFGGNEENLNDILELKNFYVGVNGVVTFKNSGLDKVMKRCPISRVVIETDSPWLAPVPNRGKRNESSYLSQIIKKLSEVYEITENEVAMQTTNNACNVFSI